jgi:hypothetical protein
MTDPMTNFLSALVEAIDADEAAVNAQGKADAHRCYDRREEADQRMRRALDRPHDELPLRARGSH